MVILGNAVRERSFEEQMLLYFLGLVCLSSAMANQYLAIPILSVCLLGGPLAYAYFGFAGLFLFFHSDGLGFMGLYGTNITVFSALSFGYVVSAWIIFAILIRAITTPVYAKLKKTN